MLQTLIDHYANGKQTDFAKLIHISAQNLSKCLSNGRFDAQRLHDYCPGISAEWLFTGEGDFLNDDSQNVKTLAVSFIGNTATSTGPIANEIHSSDSNRPLSTEAVLQISTLQDKLASMQALLNEKERLIQLYESMNKPPKSGTETGLM